MNFDDLYNRIFISEQDEQPEAGANTEVADPADFDDVEPAPLPEPASEPEMGTEDSVEGEVSPESSSSLMSYIDDLRNLANKLVNEKNPSQTLIGMLSNLDKPATPYERIGDDQMRSRILQAKQLLNTIADELADYSIKAVKS
jgi:hypothetical protein